MVVEAASRRAVYAAARSPLRRSSLWWSRRASGRVFSLVKSDRRDLSAGAGSARRRRRPSRCFLSSRSASVLAVFPPAQLEGLGGCTGANRPAVAASFGSVDGDLQGAVCLEQGSWKREGRSGVLLRLRGMEPADLQSVEHGDAPPPTCPKVSVPSFYGGSLNRLTKLLQRWCFGGFGFVGSLSSHPPAVLWRRRRMETRVEDVVCKGLQGLGCTFVFWGVFCAKFQGHMCFWVLLVCAACVRCNCFELMG